MPSKVQLYEPSFLSSLRINLFCPILLINLIIGLPLHNLLSLHKQPNNVKCLQNLRTSPLCALFPWGRTWFRAYRMNVSWTGWIIFKTALWINYFLNSRDFINGGRSALITFLFTFYYTKNFSWTARYPIISSSFRNYTWKGLLAWLLWQDTCLGSRDPVWFTGFGC